MKDFNYYLKKFGEIGFIEESLSSIVYVEGLPEVRPGELVIFETNDGNSKIDHVGQVLSLTVEYAEVLLFTNEQINVGTKVARTGETLTMPVGEEMMGKTIVPLGGMVGEELKQIDTTPSGLSARSAVNKPLVTGVTIVDLVVPLGKGQRELIIGDGKTGKTMFLLQTMLTQALSGTICIYAAVGKRQQDTKKVEEFIKKNKIEKSCVIIASDAADPAGLVYVTPYAAMSVAEYFRDLGRDVLIILDDLTTHARYYREISLLLRRFPGRDAYPGDIFYAHSRLLERGGCFKLGNKEVSISCLPVAESKLGDLSGFIQTNLMAITDGHIYFDRDLFNKGYRPAVSPYLSVTRVGRQAHIDIVRDISREISSFLVSQTRMRQHIRFGAELGEEVQQKLALGEQVSVLFDQTVAYIVPLEASIFMFGALWADIWKGFDKETIKSEIVKVISRYNKEKSFRDMVIKLVNESKTLSELKTKIASNPEMVKVNLSHE